MSKSRLFMIVIASMLLTNCASGDHTPFSAEQPVVRDPDTIAQRLQAAVKNSDLLGITAIGQICYDKFTVPLWLLKQSNSAPNAPKVLITAGVHGNEPAGVESAVRLAERLARDPDTYHKFAFEVIPLVNPWGWSRDIRFNQQGIDINRDFVSLASQEARIISNYLQRAQYHLIVDLHEDPAAQGFYMYQYGRPDKTILEPIVTAIAARGYPIEQDIKMVTLKTQNGIIDAPLWGLRYMQLTRQLSITNYGRLYNSTNVFTIETPTVLQWEDRLQIQHQALEMLFEALLETDPS